MASSQTLERPRSRKAAAHVCPSCGASWALSGRTSSDGVWLVTCRVCPWNRSVFASFRSG